MAPAVTAYLIMEIEAVKYAVLWLASGNDPKVIPVPCWDSHRLSEPSAKLGVWIQPSITFGYDKILLGFIALAKSELENGLAERLSCADDISPDGQVNNSEVLRGSGDMM